MHYSQIPPKPIQNVRADQTSVPFEDIFFFERENGTILHTNEKMAWQLYSKGTSEIGAPKQRLKLVGVGNGQIYCKAVQEAQQAGLTDLAKAQEIMRAGFKAELEAARGTVKAPRNFDEMDRGGNPRSISSLR